MRGKPQSTPPLSFWTWGHATSPHALNRRNQRASLSHLLIMKYKNSHIGFIFHCVEKFPFPSDHSKGQVSWVRSQNSKHSCLTTEQPQGEQHLSPGSNHKGRWRLRVGLYYWGIQYTQRPKSEQVSFLGHNQVSYTQIITVPPIKSHSN